MNKLKNIKHLADMGFYVFPLVANSKVPSIQNPFPSSVNTKEGIKQFWYDDILEIVQPENIAIYTGRYKENEALLVVDIDAGKGGYETLQKIEGNENTPLPKTLTQKTPSGGLHYIYKTREAVKQGVDVLGKGIDIRSRGGYIVAAGSGINGKKYVFDKDGTLDIAFAPEWLIKKCEERKVSPRKNKVLAAHIDPDKAAKRATSYLRAVEPAVHGEGGDLHTFTVAAKLRDFGVSEDVSCDLMAKYWNHRCQPPWDGRELERKVANAYRYSHNDLGVDAIDNDFENVDEGDKELALSPVDKINKEFAYVRLDGASAVLHEDKTNDRIDYMSVQTFRDELTNTTCYYEGKSRTFFEMWMASPKRRSYRGVGFFPDNKPFDKYYNLWRGMSLKPLGDDEKPTKKMKRLSALFREHLLENICDGEERLYKWLFGFFAHLVQRPGEKPIVSVVIRGKKGTGKTSVFNNIGRILGDRHYAIFSDASQVFGRFNEHVEPLLMCVLDEAFWSGSKQLEGPLKTFITEDKISVERKGRKRKTVKFFARVVILGNEDWIVPASEDERRFAVFNIGLGWVKKKHLFIELDELFKDGESARLLLRDLMGFDLKTSDVNTAPDTLALFEQKIESIQNDDGKSVARWWHQCLESGTLHNEESLDENSPVVWERDTSHKRLHDNFLQFCKDMNIRGKSPVLKYFRKDLEQISPPMEEFRQKSRRLIHIPSLGECRLAFEKWADFKAAWPKDITELASEEDIFS